MIARIALLLVTLFASPAWAGETLDTILEGGSKWTPLTGLQLVTIKGGAPDQSVALGSARLAPNVPLTPDHKMRVASISKLVTAIAAMQLVERGAVSLDSDVSQYLGWPLENPNFPEEPITLAQLLSHTSSLRDGQQYWLVPGHSVQEFFREGTGAHEDGAYEDGAHFASGSARGPGDYFTYANINFGVVASIIEAVSGERFDQYVTKHIMAPLGLTASFNVCDIPAAELATLYRGTTPQVDGDTLLCHYGSAPVKRGESAAPARLKGYRTGDNATLFSPQGGLRASASDLAVIMRMLMGHGTLDGVEILKAETVTSMLTPCWTYDAATNNGDTGAESGSAGLMTAYGLSVHIINLKPWGLSREDRILYGHLGQAYGLLGGFWFDPETNYGFISLITGTNTPPDQDGMGASPLYRVEEELMRWWLAQEK